MLKGTTTSTKQTVNLQTKFNILMKQFAKTSKNNHNILNKDSILVIIVTLYHQNKAKTYLYFVRDPLQMGKKENPKEKKNLEHNIDELSSKNPVKEPMGKN